MRHFESLKECLSEVTREVYEMGIRVHPESMQDMDVRDNADYETLELMGYSYSVKADIPILRLKADLDEIDRDLWRYCITEHDDRLSGMMLNPGNSYHYRAKLWEKFIHEGYFAYTYSERMNYVSSYLGEMRGLNQMDMARLIMSKSPGSRQNVIQIYQADKDNHHRMGVRRVPCSMHYQLIVRNGELHMIYVMRSCDVHTHFPVDITLAILLLQHFAAFGEYKAGKVIHQIGSLHVYKKDAKQGVF